MADSTAKSSDPDLIPAAATNAGRACIGVDDRVKPGRDDEAHPPLSSAGQTASAMTAETASSRLGELLRQLQEVLEEERSVLLSGRPQRVGRAVERKLQLAAEIERAWTQAGIARPDRETVLQLDHINRGNAVICSAVLRHLTRTLDRLRRGDSHRSYRPDGGEAQPPAPGRLGAA